MMGMGTGGPLGQILATHGSTCTLRAGTGLGMVKNTRGLPVPITTSMASGDA
jgi:hypothetical protein